MPRARPADAPYRPSSTATPGVRRQNDKAASGATARANRRFQLWRHQAALGDDVAVRTRYGVVCQAIADGELPGSVPSQSGFYQLVALGNRVREAQQRQPGIEDFRDRPRSGRPPRTLAKELQGRVRADLLAGRTQSVPQLHARACQEAERQNLPLPSRHQVRGYVRQIDPVEVSVALHGSKAGLLDSIPHLPVPAEYPHAVWTLDEAQLPIYIQVRKPDGTLTAEQPWMVVVMDNHTRVILSAVLIEPFGEVTDSPDDIGNGVFRPTERHRRSDILGAVARAALPELAPPELRMYTGYLPRILRFDRDQTHGKLRKMANTLGIDAPELPGEEPWRRGNVERLIGSLKDFCRTVHGATDRFEVAEFTNEDPDVLRGRTLQTRAREPRKLPLAIDQLLTFRQLQGELSEIVRMYNHRNHRELRMSPHERYRERLDPREVRPGRDLIRWFDSRQRPVGHEGISFGSTTFAAENDQVRLFVGDEVRCYCEPMAEAIYVDIDEGDPVCFRRRDLYALTVDVASRARADRRRVADAEERAVTARERDLAARIGYEAVDRAKEIQAAAVEKAKKQRAKRRTERRQADKVAKAVTGASAKPRQPAAPARPPQPSALMAPVFTLSSPRNGRTV